MTSDLIVFGEDWGGLPSSTQHLARQLNNNRKILWVNSIGLRKPRLNIADCRRALSKLTSSRSTGPGVAAQSCPDFSILNPTTIPAPANRVERLLARKLLLRQLLPAIRRANLHRPILWMSLPTAVDLVGELGERAAVYYCGDDFSALAGVDHRTVAAREQELHEKANLIITASAALERRFPAAKTRLLTQGVAYKLFSTASARAVDLPDNGKPIAGFYGSLSEWLDLDLLAATIGRLPHWNFVFIGKADVDVSRLESFANVYLLGPKPHSMLPAYSQHWDVSLLPFVDNAQIRACNPLKLSEYLAAGTPIVSTPFPALQPYRSLLSVVHSADDMVAAIEESRQPAQHHNSPARRRNAVAQQSWQARAERVSDWLETL
jgi:glycosyltransferase involved in cell wall biosynthesis